MATYNIYRDAWDSDAKEYIPTRAKTYDDVQQFINDVNKYANLKGHDNWLIVRELVLNETGGMDYFYRGVSKKN